MQFIEDGEFQVEFFFLALKSRTSYFGDEELLSHLTAMFKTQKPKSIFVGDPKFRK